MSLVAKSVLFIRNKTEKDLITENKHLQGGRGVASKELLNLKGRGVTRRGDKKLTPEKLPKKQLKNSLECA